MTGAVEDAEQSVAYADGSSDATERMLNLTTLADALHQAGRRDDAQARFREAEEMQAKSQPEYPQLYALQGFQYCDLLLAASERAAWQLVVAANWRSPQTPRTTPDAQAKEDGGEHQFAATKLLESCHAVGQRAAQTLAWAERDNWLLDVALDHLTLGRAALYRAILEHSSLDACHSPLGEAVSGLRRVGAQEFIVPALLTRAWLRFLEGDAAGAQADLDEAWQIAERGPMRLHAADIRAVCLARRPVNFWHFSHHSCHRTGFFLSLEAASGSWGTMCAQRRS